MLLSHKLCVCCTNQTLTINNQNLTPIRIRVKPDLAATLNKTSLAPRPNEARAQSSREKPKAVDNRVPPGTVVASSNCFIISLIDFVFIIFRR